MRPTARQTKLTLLALAGGASLSAGSIAAPIVFHQDFEKANTVGKEWSQRGISNTQELGKFSNRMNNGELTLTVDTMNNQVYTLVFDLYVFGDWNGNNGTFSVRAEGSELFRETFSNTGDFSAQTYAGAPDLFGDLGYAKSMDSAYRAITMEFDGRNPSTTLRFMAQGLGNMGSQSWAIDNVSVFQGVLSAAAPAVPGPATTLGLGLLGGAAMLRRRRRAAVVVGALAGGVAASANAGVVVYQQDFENTSLIGPEWSNTKTDYAPAFTRFSQRRSNEQLTLMLDTTPGGMYSLLFDLYLIDSWDGSHPSWGNDRFEVTIGGQVVFSELLDNKVDSPYSTFRNPDEIGYFGFGARDVDRDTIFRGVALEFGATGEQTLVVFSASGLQERSDESWGIDNVFVTMAPIPAPGTAGFALFGAAAMLRRRRAVAAAALAAGAATTSANAGVVVYQQDFESASLIGPEWSSNKTDFAAPFTRFSQRRTNDQLTLTINTIAGRLHTLQFDLYLIDSWDGSDATWGQDRFNVKADGAFLFSEFLDNSMDSPNSSYRNPDEVGHLGFGSRDFDRDTIYRGITLEFTANHAQTTLAFFGSGLQSKSDESWGIDNVIVTMAAIPSPATAGVMLGAGAALAGRRRRE